MRRGTALLCVAIVLLATVAVAVAAATSNNTVDPFWQRVDQNQSFTPRASAISAYFPASQRWLIFSGYNEANGTDNTLYDAWRSDNLGVRWSQVAPVPFLRCEMAADTVVTSPGVTSLFVSGGVDFVSHESFQDVWRSDDEGTSFQLVTPKAEWPGRHAHAMVNMAAAGAFPVLVVAAGYSFHDTHADFLNDIWRSTNYGQNWTIVTASAPWSARADAGFTVAGDGTLFVVGGYGNKGLNLNGFLNDVWQGSPDLTRWRELTPAASWWPRWGQSLEFFNNTLVMIGGEGGKEWVKTNDIWISYDTPEAPLGSAWTWVGNATFSGRCDFMTEVIGNYLYVAGGEDDLATDLAHVSNQVWRTRIFTGPIEPPSPPEPEPSNGGDGSSSSTGASSGGSGTEPEKDHPMGLTTPELIGVIAAVAVVLLVGAYFCFRSEKTSRVPHDSQYHLQE